MQESLRQRIVLSIILPPLLILDTLLDKRLIRTLVQYCVAILHFRNNKQGLLLSELGSYMDGYHGVSTNAPAGTKRLSNLFRSLKWSIFHIESYLLLELLSFDLAGCAEERVRLEGGAADEPSDEEQKRASVLNWRRTSKDLFAGYWDLILTWMQANPTRSSGDILRELQSLFPGRYEGSHLRTLQRGMRKIRAYLLQTPEEAGSPERLGEQPVFPAELSPAQPDSACLDAPSFSGSEQPRSPGIPHMCSSDRQQAAEEQLSRLGRPTRGSLCTAQTSSLRGSGQIIRSYSSASSGPQREKVSA